MTRKRKKRRNRKIQIHVNQLAEEIFSEAVVSQMLNEVFQQTREETMRYVICLPPHGVDRGIHTACLFGRASDYQVRKMAANNGIQIESDTEYLLFLHSSRIEDEILKISYGLMEFFGSPDAELN